MNNTPKNDGPGSNELDDLPFPSDAETIGRAMGEAMGKEISQAITVNSKTIATLTAENERLKSYIKELPNPPSGLAKAFKWISIPLSLSAVFSAGMIYKTAIDSAEHTLADAICGNTATEFLGEHAEPIKTWWHCPGYEK